MLLVCVRQNALKARHIRSRHLLSICGRPGYSTRALAIETSCDDTSVAVVDFDRKGHDPALRVLFHGSITANNDAYAGIHPLVALDSHQQNIGPLVQEALRACSDLDSRDVSDRLARRNPDVICATRGPGMVSSLSVGLNTAKGLALAFDVPLIGVHHMQAHALTPRLVHATRRVGSNPPCQPALPYLTVLVSGGHTLLLNSKSLTDHKILAETIDVALGDCLDKAARAIVPLELLKAPYGKALEEFAFPNGETDYKLASSPNQDRSEAWRQPIPLPLTKGKDMAHRMQYSFNGIYTTAVRIVSRHSIMTLEDRRDLAREVLRVSFVHIASRLVQYLDDHAEATTLRSAEAEKLNTIVISGGVAANKYLRHVFRQMLDDRGYSHLRLDYPPVELCGDNALMIAWAGLEMYHAGYTADLSIAPVRKWSMDPESADGGILGVGGWLRS